MGFIGESYLAARKDNPFKSIEPFIKSYFIIVRNLSFDINKTIVHLFKVSVEK